MAEDKERGEAGGGREGACPLKVLGMSMASSTVRGGRDRSAVENGYGGVSERVDASRTYELVVMFKFYFSTWDASSARCSCTN